MVSNTLKNKIEHLNEIPLISSFYRLCHWHLTRNSIEYFDTVIEFRDRHNLRCP